MNKKIILLPVLYLFTLFAVAQEQPATTLHINGETATLKQGHPRLILTDQRFAELRQQHKKDTVLQRYVSDVIKSAEDWISKKPLTRVIDNRNMLSVSREALERIYTLAFAWRWTGEEKYAVGALTNMKVVCEFPDWNPSHFLDVAEMTNAVSIGYDWMFGRLDGIMEEMIREAITKKGLDEGLKIYANPTSGFHMRVNNWNQVCNSGMMIGAMAIGDRHPEYLQNVIPRAVETMPKAMEAFDPEGVCVEGPGYWHYAIRYCVYGFAAMETALGTDFGLSTQHKGFEKTGYFPIVTTGPTGMMLSYSDTKMGSPRKPLAPMMWLAGRFGNPDFSEAEHDVLLRYPAQVFHVMYYQPRKEGWSVETPLDIYMESLVEIACMRSGNDSDALFVGIKGGVTDVSHVQLDMGNFEMEALGERWVVDLGADSYSLPGYFDFKVRRWNYYRNVTRSHNLPVFNGSEQALDSAVKFIDQSLNVSQPYVIVDLDNAYRNEAIMLRRGLRLVDNRRAVVVQDEITLPKAGYMDWGLMTDSELTVEGNKATFTKNGKKMTATILSPAGAVFTVKSARQEAPQNTNEGISRLVLEQNGVLSTTVSVLLAPHWEDGQTVSSEVLPLKMWNK